MLTRSKGKERHGGGLIERRKVERPSEEEEEICLWYPRLFRTALRMTGNHQDAADVTQQAFCQALDAWGRFKADALPMTWLYRILVNCVRDRARRAAVRSKRTVSGEALHQVAAAGPAVGERLENEERTLALREAIEQLPMTMQEAFVLVIIDGYSYQQAAEILGLPAGTVGSRVHNARVRLSSAMRKRFQEITP